MPDSKFDGNNSKTLLAETNDSNRTPTPLKVDPTTKRLLIDTDGDPAGGSDGQVQYNNGGSLGGASALYYDDVNNRLGIGTTSPAEILHIKKATGNYTTIRFDSGTTQGFFYAYDSDNVVAIGSNSDAQFNFLQNNAVRAYLDTDGNFNVRQPSGQHTWLTVTAPAADPQEATLTLKLDYGSGNYEFIDWTLEDYGVDHKASVNISKKGTGTLVPFIIRYWDSDLGDVATFGKTYFTITPSSEVVINDDSQDVDFRVESDGNANMLFVDGGNNRVGIGTNAPSEILHISKTSGFTTIRFDAGSIHGYFFADDGGYVGIGSASDHPLLLRVNNATMVSIDDAGHITFKDGGNFIFGTSSGTRIGWAANQKIAFYGATPIVQQTGVAVTAAAIHAALVNLGLITA